MKSSQKAVGTAKKPPATKVAQRIRKPALEATKTPRSTSEAKAGFSPRNPPPKPVLKPTKVPPKKGEVKAKHWEPEKTVPPKKGDSTKTLVKNDYRMKYMTLDGTGADNNDALAQALRESLYVKGTKTVDVEALQRVAVENGVDVAKWSHLNIGMQRMNLSNVLRAKVRNGIGVVIGMHRFETKGK